MMIVSIEPELEGTDDAPPNFTDRPIPFFDDRVPGDFLQQTIALLFNVYGMKDEQLSQFPLAERHDLWPQHRRAIFERDWRELALSFGLSGKSDLNKSLNAYHTTVSSGPIVITESHVEDRRYLPRPAEFRNTLTRSSQPMLFSTAEVEVSDPSAKIYAILTHGTYGEDPLQPGWADIIFPAVESETTVIAHRIRLFEDRYADLVAQCRAERQPPAAEPEVVQDQANPTLRRSEEFGG